MLAQTFKFFILLFFILIDFSTVYAQNSNDYVIIKEFKVIGNKTTQESILTREIPFSINDTIQNSKLKIELEKVKNNLFNTSLFNFVTVDPVYFDDKNISIYIMVEERWYWWPIPIFEIQETNFNTWWLNKDFNRVNYGLSLSKENFRGRKETLSFLFQDGYTEKIGVNYAIPYINKRKTNGLNMSFSYSRNHEITYAVTNNSRDFFRSENEFIQKEINSSIGYELRPKLYDKHNFNLEYSNVNISDSVFFLNPNYLINNKLEMQYFSVNYTFKKDKRNVKNYPTKGSYIDFKLFKDGLGIVSDLNSFYLTSHLKRFFQLSDKFYFASSVKAKVTVKEGPYYLLNAFAFGNDIVRGYELYVVNGKSYGLAKMQLRYSLLKNKVFNISAIRPEKFNKIPLDIYFGGYFDAGYVDSKHNEQLNNLANTTLYGGGVSLDFVSYYDLVLRVEYSINKLNEKGLFLHFIAPI